jgi:hypothetical integral membrane protein (TIGR02206 family)
MLTNFQRFGTAHLFILCAVPLLAAILAVAQRRLAPGSRWIRLSLAVIILVDTAVYYGYMAMQGQLTFPERVPLELCDASMCLIIVALFTLNRWIFDVAYYTVLAGATMALLTPNLIGYFPSFSTVQYFVDHGLTVTGALYLVWSKLARPRPWSVARAMVFVNLFALVAGTFDFKYKTNFMYLRHIPESGSLLNFLGPWPWYIVVAEGVALGLFVLLYLPFRRSAVKAM